MMYYHRYFRQLQDISDSVAEVEWEGSLVDAIRIAETERLAVEGKITTGIGRARYLENLTEDKVATNGVENPDDDDKDCIICREEVR
jgi:E3 ubiquitin-protein ligase SHPRH